MALCSIDRKIPIVNILRALTNFFLKELLEKCQDCVKTIRVAKDQQAAKANKNATILLEELDMEKVREESKKAAAARRRERKKKKKLEKKEEKRKLHEENQKNEMMYGDEEEEEEEDEKEAIEEGNFIYGWFLSKTILQKQLQSLSL